MKKTTMGKVGVITSPETGSVPFSRNSMPPFSLLAATALGHRAAALEEPFYPVSFLSGNPGEVVECAALSFTNSLSEGT